MAIGAKLVAVIPNQAVLYVGNPKEAEFVLGNIKRLTTWQSFEKRQPFKANVRLDERRMQESGCQADEARPDGREDKCLVFRLSLARQSNARQLAQRK